MNNYGVPLYPISFLAQMSWVLVGLSMVMLGVAVFDAFESWRLRGQGVGAVIVGVRKLGYDFHNVYQYPAPDGVTREATSLQGDGSLAGRETGRSLPILVLPGHPELARDVPSPAIWALSSGLVLAGAWFVCFHVNAKHRSPITWLVWALIAAYVGRKVWRGLPPYLARVMSETSAAKSLKSVPIEAAETLRMAPPGARPGVSSRSLLPLCLGLIVLALDYPKLVQFQKGIRTEGTIVGFRNYKNRPFPDVRFADTKGAITTFKDNESVEDLPFRAGDHVTVLYLPGREKRAMIDYGLHNWETFSIFLILGLLLTSLGISSLSTELRNLRSQ